MSASTFQQLKEVLAQRRIVIFFHILTFSLPLDLVGNGKLAGRGAVLGAASQSI